MDGHVHDRIDKMSSTTETSKTVTHVKRASRRVCRPFFCLLVIAVASLAIAAPQALAAAKPVVEIQAELSTVTTNCAVFEASINPEGAATTYHFVYLTEAQYQHGEFSNPAAETTPESSSIGSDSSFHTVSIEVCGLAPDTRYRYGAVATNSSGAAISQAGSFAPSFITPPFSGSHGLLATFGSAVSSPSDPYPLSSPSDVEIDQASHDIYVTDPGVNEKQTISLTATGGTYTLTFDGQTTDPIAATAGRQVVQSALEALPTIGANNVTVLRGVFGLDPLVFVGALASTNVEQIEANSSGLTGGSISVETIANGHPGSAVEKFNERGEFLLIFGKGVNKGKVEAAAPEAEQNVCIAGEACQVGKPSSSPGGFQTPTFLAVDNSHGPSAGDVYVGDTGDNLVQKFTSTGHIISSWGVAGQKNGTDSDLGLFGPLYGVAVGPTGNLYVGGLNASNNIFAYQQNGTFIPPYHNLGSHAAVKTDPNGLVYGVTGEGVIEREHPEKPDSNEWLEKITEATSLKSTGLALDSSAGDMYLDHGGVVSHYGAVCNSEAGSCDPSECVPHVEGSLEQATCRPLDSFGSGDLAEAGGLAVGRAHRIYVANAGKGDVAVFADIRPRATTGPAEDVEETTVTLSGQADPENEGENRGPIAECYFEYGLTSSYGSSIPCQPDPESAPPGSNFSSSTAVTADLSGLTPITELPPGSTYHYRIVAVNRKGGTALGRDETFRTTAPPTIEGTSSSGVTASSANLTASVNPNGLDTTYHFEYGTTSAYGQTAPIPDADLGGGRTVEHISVPISGLQPTTYHFRLVAHNALGTTISEDQTFLFFPPACPNAAVRQQTGSAYLPDCRAYELVSPRNANGTLLYPGGPNTGQATSPSRFSFTGAYSAIAGNNTIDTVGDLYVSTRTDSGWETKYVGLPGDQSGCMGGPPNLESSRWDFENPEWMTNTIPTDPSMNRFLLWKDGTPIGCVLGNNAVLDANWNLSPPSNAPYMFNADGTLAQRLPSEVESTPGTLEAFKCPYPTNESVKGECTGDVAASGDLSHFAFSSRSHAFAAGGLTAAPGSAYDDNLSTHTITLISRLANGDPIPQDPSFATVPPAQYIGGNVNMPGGDEEFIRFPAVSTDGSHILMSTATATTEICQREEGPVVCPRFTDTPIHLYMSVDDAAAYEVSENRLTHENVGVNYVDMTPDGSKVFFTSKERLNAEDHDNSIDLYMWSAAKAEHGQEPLTLISKGDNEGNAGEPGNTDSCAASWTSGCNAVPYSGYAYSWLTGGAGGNGIDDSAIASENGDIYFYSPERLDGTNGVAGGQNLYDYREGHAQYVTTLNPEVRCVETDFHHAGEICSEGPIVRMEVSPDDSHMAFVTATQLTSYDNAGHLEMYSYTPSSGAIVCDSCNPDGKSATADVQASQDGLFMTEDGRTFFATTEALVPQDTNEGTDVYEYVDGRPQLITSGTGTATAPQETEFIGNPVSTSEIPGLVGVSANGTDVYFSTFDSLIPEDHNGNFYKFYDARSDGGFSQPPPSQPCAAAEECHGPGTEAPQLPTQGTAATITGGNATPGHQTKQHKKKKKKQHKKKSVKHLHSRAGRRHRSSR